MLVACAFIQIHTFLFSSFVLPHPQILPTNYPVLVLKVANKLKVIQNNESCRTQCLTSCSFKVSSWHFSCYILALVCKPAANSCYWWPIWDCSRLLPKGRNVFNHYIDPLKGRGVIQPRQVTLANQFSPTVWTTALNLISNDTTHISVYYYNLTLFCYNGQSYC